LYLDKARNTPVMVTKVLSRLKHEQHEKEDFKSEYTEIITQYCAADSYPYIGIDTSGTEWI